jgi:ketosteroid isomerase-like protein
MVEVDIDADVVDAARDAAARSGRSVEEQVAFWVRLGREVERSSRGER